MRLLTAQDEYSIEDKGPGFDSAARTVLRVDIEPFAARQMIRSQEIGPLFA